MREDDGRRVELKRPLDDDARVHASAVDSAGKGAIEFDDAMPVVQLC